MERKGNVLASDAKRVVCQSVVVMAAIRMAILGGAVDEWGAGFEVRSLGSIEVKEGQGFRFRKLTK
jgi:hypothetical protein